IDVVLVRPPAGVRVADTRRLAARARERGSVLVPLGDAWTDPVDLHLEVTASRWRGLGQGHGHLEARWVEVAAGGRGAAARERHVHLWLPAYTPPWGTSRPPGYVHPAATEHDQDGGTRRNASRPPRGNAPPRRGAPPPPPAPSPRPPPSTTRTAGHGGPPPAGPAATPVRPAGPPAWVPRLLGPPPKSYGAGGRGRRGA